MKNVKLRTHEKFRNELVVEERIMGNESFFMYFMSFQNAYLTSLKEMPKVKTIH
jgi:hypothetical protein